MLLSIIVPCYNVEKYLGICINSLLDQDISKDTYEIVVIDDGSKDGSLKIANDYATRFNNVSVISQENQGISATRNVGIAEAKGKYIYFIDSDDYIAKDTLGYVTRILEKYDLEMLGVDAMNTRDANQKLSLNIDRIKNEKIQVIDGITFIAQNNYINQVWWYFIKRDFLLESKIIFPVGRVVEDANFSAELIARAERMVSSPLDFYRYVFRSNSIMNTKDSAHDIRMIGDYEKNVYVFADQLKQLKHKEHPQLSGCVERLKSRQQSFIFMLLVRTMRSDFSLKKVSEMLTGFEKIHAYPMKDFIGKDYNGLKYSVLVSIFNRRFLLFPFIKIFRVLNKLRGN